MFWFLLAHLFTGWSGRGGGGGSRRWGRGGYLTEAELVRGWKMGEMGDMRWEMREKGGGRRRFWGPSQKGESWGQLDQEMNCWILKSERHWLNQQQQQNENKNTPSWSQPLSSWIWQTFVPYKFYRIPNIWLQWNHCEEEFQVPTYWNGVDYQSRGKFFEQTRDCIDPFSPKRAFILDNTMIERV